MFRTRLILTCAAVCAGCTAGGGIVNITVPESTSLPSVAQRDMSVAEVVTLPGIHVTPSSGLTTTTSGGQATFLVVLESKPLGDVNIAVVSSDHTQGTVSPSSLTFNFSTWNVPQRVTVSGVDDFSNGNHAYTVTLEPSGDDPGYSALHSIVLSLVNIDTDVPGFIVTPTSGLTTTPGLSTASFTVRLKTPPTATVTAGLTSSDTNQGTVTAPALPLTFTTTNWNAPQTVTITGVDDHIFEGNKPYTITFAPAVSTDTNYSGLVGSPVSVTNIEVDVVGIAVAPTSGLTTTKAGGPASFNVHLDSEPVGTVNVTVLSNDLTKGTTTPSPLTLAFTSANWNTVTPNVTITGVNDNKVTGDTTYTVGVKVGSSADPNYPVGLAGATVSLTSSDTNIANILLSRTSGLQTVECGNGCQPHMPAYGTDTFTVKLSTQPTANVTIGITSDNTLKGTVSGSSGLPLVFTNANWNTAQTVTVTGAENTIVDNPPNVVYHVVTAAATSADSNYNGMNPSDVTVTSIDDDVYIYAGGTNVGASMEGDMVWCTNASNCANGLVVNMPYRGGTADFVVWIAGSPHGVFSNECGGGVFTCASPPGEFPPKQGY